MILNIALISSLFLVKESLGALSSRRDVVTTIISSEGWWGHWSNFVYCNENEYVYGYRMRVEHAQGHGDDTAANAIQLYCSKLGQHSGSYITPHQGLWGSWSSAVSKCSSKSFIKGYRTKIEPQQGRGDDTALNSVGMYCDNGNTIEINNPGRWGFWGSWQFCPAGSLVCGVKVRFEARQGHGDDTALNSVVLACCAKNDNWQGTINYRKDLVNMISSSQGWWGFWTNMAYCNENEYVYGYRMRVERAQGRGDDTAANAIELYCAKLGTHYTTNIIKPHNGYWGQWSSSIAQCPGTGFINGYRSKIEPHQGRGDDTALNSVQMYCNNGHQIEINNPGPWGNWGWWAHCPSGSLVCGVKERIETVQGWGDDTGLNSVVLACCATSYEFSNIVGKWYVVSSYFGGGGEQIKKKVYGMESSTTTDFSSDYIRNLQSSSSAGFKFNTLGASKAISGSVSRTVTHTVAKSFIKLARKTSAELVCDKKYIVQFILSGEEKKGNIMGNFDIKTNAFLCTDSHDPKCPPSYCDDEDCTVCKNSYTAAAKRQAFNYIEQENNDDFSLV